MAPVAFPSGFERLLSSPPATGSPTAEKMIGIVVVRRCNSLVAAGVCTNNTSGFRSTSSCAYSRIRAISPAPKRMSKRMLRPSNQPRSARSCTSQHMRLFISGSAFVAPEKDYPSSNAVALLGARRQRLHADAPAEQLIFECATPHSMTSSAATRRPGGTVSPSALAVLRLIASWNLAGACTGRSRGLAPLRMRSM